MLKFDELPALPEADRILVLPDPPKKTTEGGIEIPEIGQRRANYGKIMAAGLAATDVLYDNGARVGDRIWFGQYAGVIEEWDHIVKDGRDPKCDHDWDRAPEMAGPSLTGYKCKCGAVRLQEPLLVMNVGDILANVDKAARVRDREITPILGKTAAGKTQHFFQYGPNPTPGLTTNGVTHAS